MLDGDPKQGYNNTKLSLLFEKAATVTEPSAIVDLVKVLIQAFLKVPIS